MTKLVGVLLAAGRSRRMLRDKRRLPHPIGGIWLQHALAAFRPAVDELWVVLQPADRRLQWCFDPFRSRYQCEFFYSAQAHHGMGASLADVSRQLLASHDSGVDVMVSLADLPDLRVWDYRRLAEQWRQRPGGIRYFQHQGRRGHPVIFDARYLPQLASLQGDQGARQLLRRHATDCASVLAGHGGIYQDVDTLSQWRRWQTTAYRSVLGSSHGHSQTAEFARPR